jgi:hypothetical protein
MPGIVAASRHGWERCCEMIESVAGCLALGITVILAGTAILCAVQLRVTTLESPIMPRHAEGKRRVRLERADRR